MFIALIGTRAAGKSSVEHYLMSKHRFQPVRIKKADRSNLKLQADGEAAMNLPSYERVYKDKSSISTPEDLPKSLAFESAFDLLEYVTRNWRESFVSCDLDTPELIELFVKRPFFLLVAVDAPLMKRYARIVSNSIPNLTLKEFVEEHDELLHAKHTSKSVETLTTSHATLHDMFRISNILIVNAYDSVADFYAHLDITNLPDSDRLRPQWDTYFMTLAGLTSQRSNCMKRRVGAILVRDKRIVSTGYNGTPRHLRNCNEGGCRRCNSGVASGEALDECLCLHAEENALLEAGRDRLGQHAVLYCNTCPCLGCAIKIVQTGVKEVVYNLSYKVDERTATLFLEAGVILRQHSPPQ